MRKFVFFSLKLCGVRLPAFLHTCFTLCKVPTFPIHCQSICSCQYFSNEKKKEVFLIRLNYKQIEENDMRFECFAFYIRKYSSNRNVCTCFIVFFFLLANTILKGMVLTTSFKQIRMLIVFSVNKKNINRLTL